MENENILVTIGCITYNHQKYIKDALESFLKQKTYFRYEILIHDDASTDETCQILKEYEKKYFPLIRVVYQKENQYSKGKQIFTFLDKYSKGKYIAICEGDDYWIDEYKLQKQISYMEKNPKCGICFHNVAVLDEEKKEIIDFIKPYKKNKVARTKEIIYGDGGFIGTSSIVYRKEIMNNPPDFYLKAPVGDYPLQILTSMKDYGYYINETMSIYRVNTGISWCDKNLTYEKQKELRFKLIDMLKELDRYSNFKYSKTIKRKIKRWSYKLIKYFYSKKIKLSQKEYEELYKNLDIKLRCKIYFYIIKERVIKFK